MDQFRTAHARGAGWAQLAKSCGSELGPKGSAGNLGLLYVSEDLAGDLASIVTYLRETTGIGHWAGCAAAGICTTGQEIFYESAMAILVGNFESGRFQILPRASADVAAALVPLAGWLGKTQPRFGIVHGDPRSAAAMAGLATLAEASGCFLVGGFSAPVDDGQVADDVANDGLSGVLFAQDVEVHTGLTQGCTPIGPAHLITRVADGAVAELDEKSALAVFREEIGEVLARDLNRAAGYVHAALPVTGSDTGDYMVRNLIGVDVDQGCLAVGATLEVGDQLMFVRRDPESARQDMLRMLAELKVRVGERAKGGVYHSCVARGPNQFGPGDTEMQMIRKVFGDIPVVGFFGSGEIFHDRIYSYTGVLSLFT